MYCIDGYLDVKYLTGLRWFNDLFIDINTIILK